MMHTLVYLLLVSGSCLAQYGVFEARGVAEREEPTELDGELVECPVCQGSSWHATKESCPIKRGGKLYKRCRLGIYINEVCGNRPDCYRGPGEQCTEKMAYDVYGQRCAHGYYCNKAIGECTGLSYSVDSNMQYIINPNLRYPLRARRDAI